MEQPLDSDWYRACADRQNTYDNVSTNQRMENNPVENNFITRFILGFAVIIAMMIGGRAVGGVLISADIPYGDWIGVAIGAIAVFGVFAVLYQRYDESYNTT
ncbi:hypothetical protein ACFQAS_13180 [Halopenitus salinus]|uniref:Uncharacterized protein n=1 Tax=Halopenitus salinus TaxID=1198295 RepID=A0ABD5UUF3_9EURY